MSRMNRLAVLLLILAASFHCTVRAATPVLQRGYDAGVSGANLSETVLSTANVNPSLFGLVFTIPVDDNVYAQPLYMPGASIPGKGIHNVLYVATMSDTLYAFDADSGAQLWSINLADSVGATAVPIAQFVFGYNRNIVGNLGILSTPVIDPSTNILYLVACTLESGTMVYRLHAIDITSGTEPYGNRVISGSYNGVSFHAPHQTQRVSLALSGNQVVFGFGAVEEEAADVGGYAGWVMAYDKTTLNQSGIFATITTGQLGGGVWQSGRPPVVDSSGYVYVFVGNGFGTGYDGVHNFNESVLKLDSANGLRLVDWFTPDNWSVLDSHDADLTSSGPLLIPGTGLLAGGGKTGLLYLLNTDGLGKEAAGDSGAVQEEKISSGELHGGPVFWQRSAANGGALLFDWGSNDALKAFAFNGSTLAGSPSHQGSGTPIWPGGILALSANGDAPGSGVLWATVATVAGAENTPPVTGALLAFDAANLGKPLWSSTTNFSRDNFGLYAKFVPPLVVGGKVYVATSSDHVAIYGLLWTYTMTLTGHATQSGGTLSLTHGGANEASAAWSTTPVNVQHFTTDFTFKISPAATNTANGMTFTIQNSGPTALGASGQGLGYRGIGASVAVKFDLHTSVGAGKDSTGFYTDGALPTVPALDMTASGVNLHAGDVMHAHLTYVGTTLALTLTDTVTNASFTASTAINIPATVGAATAYVGFTGGTGGETAVQKVLTWTYSTN